MELEHLATLERLRQSQRQDYLKVMNTQQSSMHGKKLIVAFLYLISLRRDLSPALCRQLIA